MTASNPTSPAADLKTELEAIAGHPIEASADQLRGLIIRWMPPVAALAFTSITDQDAVGQVVSRNLIFPVPNTCAQERLLDVSGYSTTSASGNQVFLLSRFLCPNIDWSYDEPVNIVATAHTANPVFLSATHTLVHTPPTSPSANDVEITVYAWDANGTPVSGVGFHWRCRVPTFTVIF